MSCIYKNKSLLDMPNEEWRLVVGNSDYMVSNLGRVKSLQRSYNHPIKDNVIVPEIILSQAFNGVGYLRVQMSYDRQKQKRYVHRLVGAAFIENESGKPQINHKNGVRHDNRVENLEWATNSENGLHSFKELGRKPSRSQLGKSGSLHHRSKPVYCPTLGLKYESAGMAAKELGLSQGSISHICNNIRTHVDGLTFVYA